MAMLSVRVYKFEQKAGRKIDFDKKESARFNKKKVRSYKCLQRGHFARECRAKGGNDQQRYSSFKIQEIGKKVEDSKALITIDTLVDWTDHDGYFNNNGFSCNNSDKNENTSRTSCNNNGYFNKKAVLLRSGKVSIPAARPNQVSTGRPKPVSTSRPKPVSTGRPKPVPTDKPKVPEPVPTSRQNRTCPVPSGRRNSPSVTSRWVRWATAVKPSV
ncbi:ribonuclease H-like domain-containing protein, partial [Tanacetum coccineum]